MNSVNSLQSTIADLKEIVQRNQGTSTEAFQVVQKLEQIAADIERKTRKPGITIAVTAHSNIQTIPVV